MQTIHELAVALGQLLPHLGIDTMTAYDAAQLAGAAVISWMGVQGITRGNLRGAS